MTTLNFAKGHGTENDFIIIPDAGDTLDLSAAQVAWLCDRRAGIGADGILRVVRQAGRWFMDYRNADGSIAEMCGNGSRVFAHWLATREGEAGRFAILTRAGERTVDVRDADEQQATVTVAMGPARVAGASQAVCGDNTFSGLAVNVGNPHLACVIEGLTDDGLARLDLSAPQFEPNVFPAGANLEILTPLRDGHVHMRVYERGVGETRSCGTGTVAAARAALGDLERGRVTVHVPGGEVTVDIAPDGAHLTGPSRIIAEGTVDLPV